MSAVDAYLDEMFDRLAGTGSAGRRTLAETEDHLRAAVADGVAGGLPADQAERAAVTRFGSPEHVAVPVQRARRRSQFAAALSGTWLLVGLLLVMLGVSYLIGGLGLELLRQLDPKTPCVGCADPEQIVQERTATGAVLLLGGLVLLFGRWLTARHTRLAPVPRRFPWVAAGCFGLVWLAALTGLPAEGTNRLLEERGSGVEQDIVTTGVGLVAVMLLIAWGLARNRQHRHAS